MCVCGREGGKIKGVKSEEKKIIYKESLDSGNAITLMLHGLTCQTLFGYPL